MSTSTSNDSNKSLCQFNNSSRKQKLPRVPRLTDDQLEQLIDEIPKQPLTKCEAQLHQLAGNVTVEVEEEPFKYIIPEEEISSDDEADKWGDDPFITHPYPKRRVLRKSTHERTQSKGRTRFGSTSTTQSRLTLPESESTGESSRTSLTGAVSFQSGRSMRSEEAGRLPSRAKGKEKQVYEGSSSSSSPRDCAQSPVKTKSLLRRWLRKSHDSP